MRNNIKGFTLIEIILAITFLLIIVIMVAPNMYRLITGGNEAQLRQLENQILAGARKYINEDSHTAAWLMSNSDNVIYISVWNLANLGYVSAGLQDPTQNQDYEYRNVIGIRFCDGEFKFGHGNSCNDPNFEEGILSYIEALSIQNNPDNDIILERSLAMNLSADHRYVYYSGIRFRYDPSITSDINGTLVLTATTNCQAVMNRMEDLLIAHNDGFCFNNNRQIMIKENIDFIRGDGTANNPFTLVGDFIGHTGETIATRFLGEWVRVPARGTTNSCDGYIQAKPGRQIRIYCPGEPSGARERNLFSGARIVGGAGRQLDPYQVSLN